MEPNLPDGDFGVRVDVGTLAPEIVRSRHLEGDEDLLGADGHPNGLPILDSGRHRNNDLFALLRLT